ncbi:MAG: DUF4177 domain-containing protein [Pseudomonadota bacterium]
MGYTYKVIPFQGKVKPKQGPDVVAAQLESAIGQMSENGWEFVEVATVYIEVKPGCIGSLLGRDSDYIRYDQIVFRRAAA